MAIRESRGKVAELHCQTLWIFCHSYTVSIHSIYILQLQWNYYIPAVYFDQITCRVKCEQDTWCECRARSNCTKAIVVVSLHQSQLPQANQGQCFELCPQHLTLTHPLACNDLGMAKTLSLICNQKWKSPFARRACKKCSIDVNTMHSIVSRFYSHSASHIYCNATIQNTQKVWRVYMQLGYNAVSKCVKSNW